MTSQEKYYKVPVIKTRYKAYFSCKEMKHRRCGGSLDDLCNQCKFGDEEGEYVERFKKRIDETNMLKGDLMNEEKRQIAKVNKVLQTKASYLGPIEQCFEESKTEMKMKETAYYKDETMTGNTAHLVFDDFRSGKNTLLKCFKDHPETHKKFLGLFRILTNIDTLQGKKQLNKEKQLLKLLRNLVNTSLCISTEI